MGPPPPGFLPLILVPPSVSFAGSEDLATELEFRHSSLLTVVSPVDLDLDISDGTYYTECV